MLTETAVGISRPNSVILCLWAWMMSQVYKRKVDTRDELLARVWDAVPCVVEREDDLRRTTRDLRTQVANCTEADVGIFEHLL
jgi:hypothetical protein